MYNIDIKMKQYVGGKIITIQESFVSADVIEINGVKFNPLVFSWLADSTNEGTLFRFIKLEQNLITIREFKNIDECAFAFAKALFKENDEKYISLDYTK